MGVVALSQRLEVGKDSLERVDSFHYFGDVISCRGRLEVAGYPVLGVNVGNWQTC